MKTDAMGAVGALSGVGSVLGSWQVCHATCLALISLLSILGITVAGMPLAFLGAWAIPLWSLAFTLLVLMVVLATKLKCVSLPLLTMNAGLVIAGIPFEWGVLNRFVYIGIGALFLIAAIVLKVKQ